MKKKLFKISGKFKQQGGVWSNKKSFVGYFSLDTTTKVFIGYTNEKYDNPYEEKEKYIKGVFRIDENKIGFYKMSNEMRLAPLIYIFTNIKKEGIWCAYWPSGSIMPQGKAKVSVQEIEFNPEKNEEISLIYNKLLEKNLDLNSYLLSEFEKLNLFIDDLNGVI